LKLTRPTAELFIPDGRAQGEALSRTTHMGIVGHPDDLEILAWPGIRDCFGRSDRWFCGVVVADGAASPRTGGYGAVPDAEMRVVRRREQRKAAQLGEYGAVALLDFTSPELKAPGREAVIRDISELLVAARPGVLYTHNLADRHDAHVAAALAVIEACRGLPEKDRPRRVLGGEVWRDLDWLSGDDRVAEDAAGLEHLAAGLIGAFDSQVSGGKRYDRAVLARRTAHATFHESHAADRTTALAFAMDLTPLVTDASLDPSAFLKGLIGHFAAEVGDRLGRLSGAR
jgi:LmbE family N-acetylglucosaminyl deacetylase